MFFGQSRVQIAPILVHEMEAWVQDGLIPPFKLTDMPEETLANMFRVVRQHISKGESNET
jgi:hypothetical protein